MRKIILHLRTLLPTALLLSGAASCKKFVQVAPPQTQVVSSVVFDEAGTATNAVLSIYGSYSSSAVSFAADLDLSQSADELNGYALAPAINYYTNSLSALTNDDFW